MQVFNESNDDYLYKVHVVLFTCAVTRAVHLDLVSNLSATAFIQSLKRFIARRGVPRLFISDNATCFKNEELKLSEELLILNVKWQYIVQAGPNWGGFYERLVGSVKRSLRKILFRATVNYEELRTVICEIEGIMNSRPLCYNYSDDTEEVITPSHLIFGRRLMTYNYSDEEETKIEDQVSLTKRMKYLQLLIDSYWGRWRNEYLTQLREYQKIGVDVKFIEKGDIVVIFDHQLKRNRWKLGKVVKLIQGSDNIPRAAILRTNTNQIKRPVTKLYPLEVKCNVKVTEDEELAAVNASSEGEDINDEIVVRPTRLAADTGVLKRRLAGQS